MSVVVFHYPTRPTRPTPPEFPKYPACDSAWLFDLTASHRLTSGTSDFSPVALLQQLHTALMALGALPLRLSQRHHHRLTCADCEVLLDLWIDLNTNYYLSMYTYIYIYTHTYIHTYICIYTFTVVYTYTIHVDITLHCIASHYIHTYIYLPFHLD